MSEIRAAVLQWLNKQGIREPSQIDVTEYAQVRQLFGTDRPGFGIFLSFIMFERQQAQAALANADLSTSSGAVAAAKLQGVIQCVDNIRELVLNLSDPIGEGDDSEDLEQATGVKFNG
jgi:hypothetical protein